jgi:hypothetical protein
MNQKIDCKIWQKKDIPFIYPEDEINDYKNKLNIGIAIPGGGNKSCTYVLGCLRGLQKIGVLQKVKYISSNSGSSWLMPLFYNNNTCCVMNYIGEYVEPEKLTLEYLDTIKESSFTDNIHNRNIVLLSLKKFIENMIYNPNNDDFWNEVIGNVYLKKYNLDGLNTLPCISSQEAKIKQYWANYAVLNEMAPFCIINASCYFDENNIIPIEFTPLYYGFPTDNSKFNINSTYIEPIGFSSNNIILSTDTKTIQINKPDNVYSLGETISYSSNAISNGLLNYINTCIYNSLNLPSITFDSKDVKICDGSFIDNTCIISLLRRNVKTIIYCNTNNDNELKNLFGEPIVSTIIIPTYMTHVFNKNKLKKINELAYGENKRSVFKMDLDVLENKFCGVKGGYKVRLIIINMNINNGLLNELSKHQNGRDIVNYITKNNIYLNKNIRWWQIILNYIKNIFVYVFEILNIISTEFKYFPYIPTIYLNYTKKLVNMMTYMGTYDVINNKDNIIKWIKK